MTHVKRNRWPAYHDIAERIEDREDPPELVDQCWQYITGEFAVSSGNDLTVARQAASKIATVQIQASISKSSREIELEESLKAAKSTIDRLLAFVPGRAAAIASARLSDISEAMTREAARLFKQPRPITTMLLEETEHDSAARYRLTLSVDLDAQLDPVAFTEIVRRIHRFMVELTTPEEYQAIRLLVEPTSWPDGPTG